MRDASKARGVEHKGVFERRATPLAPMQRSPNALVILRRALRRRDRTYRARATQAVHGAQYRLYRRRENAFVTTHAKGRVTAACELHVSHCFRLIALSDAVLAILEHLGVKRHFFTQGVHQSIDRSVALAYDTLDYATHHDTSTQYALFASTSQIYPRIGQFHAPFFEQVFALESLQDLLSGQLFLLCVRYLLDRLTELDLQIARQHQAVVLLKHVRDAALARLAIDADHSFVRAPDIARVDRQIGHLPELVAV